MSRRPTARRYQRFVSPPPLPDLRQPPPSHSLPSSLIPSSRKGGLSDLPLRASNDHYNLPPSSLVFLLGGWPGRYSNARVQRGPSEAARCASRRTTRPLLPPFLRTFLLLSTPCPLRSKPLSSSSLQGPCSVPSGCSPKPMRSGWRRWSSPSACRRRSSSPSIRSHSAPLRGSSPLQPAWSPSRCSSVPGCSPACCNCPVPRKAVSSRHGSHQLCVLLLPGRPRHLWRRGPRPCGAL